jgi:hypothetical protein
MSSNQSRYSFVSLVRSTKWLVCRCVNLYSMTYLASMTHVGKGVSGKQLSSKFGRRDDPEYIMELGNTLASLCRNIPGGVLIFFPVSSTIRSLLDAACSEIKLIPHNHTEL